MSSAGRRSTPGLGSQGDLRTPEAELRRPRDDGRRVLVSERARHELDRGLRSTRVRLRRPSLLRPGRIAGLGGFVLLVAAIGFSRLYLGVHYLTDVLAGYTAGLAVLLVAVHVLSLAKSWPNHGTASAG